MLSNKQVFQQFEGLYTLCEHCNTPKSFESAYENDFIMVNEDFSNFLDSLYSNKEITEDQVNNLDISEWADNEWLEFDCCDNCKGYFNEVKDLTIELDGDTLLSEDLCENCLSKIDLKDYL